MNLNKFQKVYIPKAKNLLERYGFRYTNNGSSTSEDAEYMCSSRNKLEQIQAVNNELYQRYASEMAERAKQSQPSPEPIAEE